jgi:hypothetical protein
MSSAGLEQLAEAPGDEELAGVEMERIVVALGEGSEAHRVAFFGRWLVEPGTHSTKGDPGICWGVAVSKRGQFVIYRTPDTTSPDTDALPPDLDVIPRDKVSAWLHVRLPRDIDDRANEAFGALLADRIEELDI